MQTKLFVFIGVFEKRSQNDLEILMASLKKKFEEEAIPIQFTRKGELLLSNFNNASFYITFLENKNELEDFYEMARNFELIIYKSPITFEGLQRRYEQVRYVQPNLYSEIHYTVGLSIFQEIDKFQNVQIFSFQ
jgi:hypothetical protein